MANRDFRKIERTIKDFSMNVGGSSNGGIVVVDKLPEVGKEDCLYKTPDGKLWSCVNKTEEKVISDLEVGKSYQLKESVKTKDLVVALANVASGVYFFDSSQSTLIQKGAGSTGGSFIYINSGNRAELGTYIPPTQDIAEIMLEGFTEIPTVEITEYFVNETQENLHYISFLFEGGSHTEEVTTCTWTEVGGSKVLSPICYEERAAQNLIFEYEKQYKIKDVDTLIDFLTDSTNGYQMFGANNQNSTTTSIDYFYNFNGDIKPSVYMQNESTTKSCYLTVGFYDRTPEVNVYFTVDNLINEPNDTVSSLLKRNANAIQESIDSFRIDGSFLCQFAYNNNLSDQKCQVNVSSQIPNKRWFEYTNMIKFLEMFVIAE